MKKGFKNILIVLLIISIIGASIFAWNLFGFSISTKSKYYEEVATRSNYLPTADSLPEHISLEYKYYEDYMFIFTSHAYTMIIEYDEKTYSSQKDVAHLPFENIDEWTSSAEEELVTNTTPIELDGFTFKMYSEWFPKFIYFIGFNDETHQIAYIYFEDNDLGSISVPYSEFIRTSCGW